MLEPRYIPNDEWRAEPRMRFLGGTEAYDFWVYEGPWSSRFYQVNAVHIPTRGVIGFEVRPCPPEKAGDYAGIERDALKGAKMHMGMDTLMYLLKFLQIFAPDVMQNVRHDILEILKKEEQDAQR